MEGSGGEKKKDFAGKSTIMRPQGIDTPEKVGGGEWEGEIETDEGVGLSHNMWRSKFLSQSDFKLGLLHIWDTNGRDWTTMD